ncbi:MAG: phosphate/phosphite/phosphonate ABC transporter substrate-binding protein [Chloroflexi bacterium]|nr:phosphate/phosphite/phosphonate ABC transporter substrate-binding protein [Chloroflexota bacterium]
MSFHPDAPVFSRLRFPLWLLSLALLGFVLSACGTAHAETLPYIDLSVRTPLPSAQEADIVPLRIAVAAIISPQGNVESYANLATYLGERLGRPVELVQRRTYAEVNELIANGTVDLAFVCTSAYVDGHDKFGMELLVAPQINGDLVYHSVLIVPAASPATSMADLQGKSFAFTDPMSFSGRVYPSYLIKQLGSTPEAFFGHVFFTYSHDRAIKSVAASIADGAAVDSLVLDYAMRNDPTLAQRIKVIHRSPAFGIPPVVVPPSLPPRQKALLRELLLSMHEDPVGKQVLDGLGIDRFVPIDDTAYVEIRQLIYETGGMK